MKLFFNFFLYLLFLFPILYTEIAFSANNPNEWENHSENIEILDIEEIMEIVSSRSAILIDVWKKDKKPDVIDNKKWFPPKRYSIPNSIWLPNIGRETLTPEEREYLNLQLKKITKNNKNEKIVFFCRRGYYSKIAAERAIKLGYTNVFLFPGTDLWEDRCQNLIIIKPQEL